MSSVWLPCGDYHQNYKEDQGWWQTRFIKGKMLLLLLVVFVGIPLLFDEYWISVATMVGYTAMGALGVQLLIGYAGLLTLGHAAFIAVGAYTSTMLILQFPWPQFMMDSGLAYPVSIFVAGIVGRSLECVVWAPLRQGQRVLFDFDHHGSAIYHRGFYFDPVYQPDRRARSGLFPATRHHQDRPLDHR